MVFANVLHELNPLCLISMSTLKKKAKLLLVGPTDGSVHVRNYYFLVRDYFEDILVVTMNPVDFCKYEIADFSIKNPLTAGKKIRRIRTIIQNYKPDVIHIHQANSCAYLTLRANNLQIPAVLTCWGSDVLVLPNLGYVHRYIVKYALRHAKVLTADARYMIDAIHRLGEKKTVVEVNFGIDFNTDISIPAKKNQIYSNRLHKEVYNIEEIIRAFASFVNTHRDWKLIIGATGDLTDNLKKLAVQLLPENSFEFIGFVGPDQNKQQYLDSRIWVSVPSSDGTSISLLEAMGYGCVPVVSDLPANREWINHAQNGIVAGADLSGALEQALKLDLPEVQKQNRQIILEKGTKEANRKIFTGIYDTILKS